MLRPDYRTIACYDGIAASYAERTMPIRLRGQMATFTALVEDGGLVLDLGCGPGRDAAWLAEQGYASIGVDRSSAMLGLARVNTPGGRWVRADMRELPFVSGRFDGVWACASLLHIPRQELPLALREVRRISSPGAALFVDVQKGTGEAWIVSENGTKRLFVYHHMEALAATVGDAGFRVRLTTQEVVGETCWLHVYAVAD